MPRSAVLARPAFRPSAPRSDGREHVVFESIVALLALLLIISGFSLYVSQAFASPSSDALQSGVIQVSTTEVAAEQPLSLAER